MNGNGKPPTSEDILQLLARLYADQMGVKVKVEIVDGRRTEHDRQQQACL